MAMSKKHYEQIAYNIQLQVHEADNDSTAHQHTKAFARAKLLSLTQKLATDFASGNPSFDRQRFLTACGF